MPGLSTPFVVEDDLHIFGDIDLQVIIHCPSLGVFDFSLPAFNIRRRDDSRVIGKFHHYVSAGSWFEIGSTGNIQWGPIAEPYIILAVICRREDKSPRYRVQ